MKFIIHNSHGFTLSGLVIRVLLIGLILGVAMPMYSASQQKSNDADRKQDVQNIKIAIEQYYGDNSIYPHPVLDLGDIVKYQYLPSFPVDPKSGGHDSESQFDYVYGASSSEEKGKAGQAYEISVNFEREVNSIIETNDKGNDVVRWEIGNEVSYVNTNMSKAGIPCLSPNTYDDDGSGLLSEGNCVIIENL